MASFRAFLLAVALLFFFVAAVPAQALLTRVWPRGAARIPLVFCRSLLGLVRVSVEVAGARAAQGPILLAVNHVSWIDVIALGSLMPFCFLAKSEVGSWPVISAFAKVQGTVFIDRARRRAIPPANQAMAARMREGRVVLLFPEGTTYDGTVPGPFRTSHFAAARDLLRAHADTECVWVQPVAIVYSAGHAAWIGDDALLPHVWRVLRGHPLRCRVSFGMPLSYERGSDRKDIAQRSRDAIGAMMSEGFVSSLVSKQVRPQTAETAPSRGRG